MKGLSSLERMILECVGNKTLTYTEIQSQTGLHENVCFNILQALIVRGILSSEFGNYRVSTRLTPLVLEEINGHRAKEAESLELIEAVVDQKQGRVFRMQKVAMDEKDEKLFLAMLSNLESFLAEAHRKAQSSVPLKDRKVVFWGAGNMQSLMTQIIQGR